MDLSTLPPRVYGALMKLKHMEDHGDGFLRRTVEVIQEDPLDVVDIEPI